jgi:hypothetical protein
VSLSRRQRPARLQPQGFVTEPVPRFGWWMTSDSDRLLLTCGQHTTSRSGGGSLFWAGGVWYHSSERLQNSLGAMKWVPKRATWSKMNLPGGDKAPQVCSLQMPPCADRRAVKSEQDRIKIDSHVAGKEDESVSVLMLHTIPRKRCWLVLRIGAASANRLAPRGTHTLSRCVCKRAAAERIGRLQRGPMRDQPQ